MLKQHQIVKKLSATKVLFNCSECNSVTEKDYYSAIKSNIGGKCLSCANELNNMKVLDSIRLNKLLNYDKSTGSLTHRTHLYSRNLGEDATYLHSQGYRAISIGKKDYLAHRIIWFMETGVMPEQIDHIDHNRSNNSWTNLREVSSRENQLNMSKKKNNTSKHTGIRVLPSGKFCAYIMVNKKQISLGSYDDIDDAVFARKQAEIKYGFHVNHGI